MKLSRVLEPITIDELKNKYFGRRCFVKVPKMGNPLADLVTLDEVETRLNDGCASLVSLAVVGKNGAKFAAREVYAQQIGPGWTPQFLRKSLVLDRLAEGHSLVMHNMSHINPGVAELISDIENEFSDFQADVHLYVSTRAQSSGYLAHRDQPQHKIYLQVFGTTHWTVFRGTHERPALSKAEADEHLEVDFEVELTPGSVLYMPPAVFHRATNPYGPRLSVSIPFKPAAGSFKVDRTHIPLAKMMRGEPLDQQMTMSLGAGTSPRLVKRSMLWSSVDSQ